MFSKKHKVYIKTLVSALSPRQTYLRKVILQKITQKFSQTFLSKKNSYEIFASSYKDWQKRFDTPHYWDRSSIIFAGKKHPPVLIIFKFTKDSIFFSEKQLKSLEQSIGQDWYAYFTFDSDCDERLIQEIRERASESKRIFFDDPRDQINVSLFVILDAAALLRPHSLFSFVNILYNHKNQQIAYSDEDDYQANSFKQSWFKPKFSPLLIRQQKLFGRIVAFRQSDNHISSKYINQFIRLDCIEAFQLLNDIASHFEEEEVTHIPHVLFHNLIPAPLPIPLILPELPELPEILPIISIIIPTKDHWDLLDHCLKSIQKSDWPRDRLEIIIIDNGSRDQKTLRGLKEIEKNEYIRIIRDERPFNYSELNNEGVRKSKGDLLLLLNNDMEVIDPLWLRKMAPLALQPQTGAVGPKLLYEDGTVQHAGIILGINGSVKHAHVFQKKDEGGYQNLANITHEVSAVTGACIMVKRSAYMEVGGLREEFPVTYNDILFCLDLHKAGYRNIYYAEALLYHYESKTRGYDITDQKKEIAYQDALRAWSIHKPLLSEDPFYSPNLSLEQTYGLSSSPRHRALWNNLNQQSKRIFILSSSFSKEDNIAFLIDHHRKILLEHGYDIILAGNCSDRDYLYEDNHIIELADLKNAAIKAVDYNVDLVISYTSPYYSLSRWIGQYPKILCINYDDASLEDLSDPVEQKIKLREKDFAFALATEVFEPIQPVKNLIKGRKYPLNSMDVQSWKEHSEQFIQRIDNLMKDI